MIGFNRLHRVLLRASPSTPPTLLRGGWTAWSKQKAEPLDRAGQGECHPNDVGGIRLESALRCLNIEPFVASPSPIMDWGRASSSRVTLRRSGDRLEMPGSIGIAFCRCKQAINPLRKKMRGFMADSRMEGRYECILGPRVGDSLILSMMEMQATKPCPNVRTSTRS